MSKGILRGQGVQEVRVRERVEEAQLIDRSEVGVGGIGVVRKGMCDG